MTARIGGGYIGPFSVGAVFKVERSEETQEKMFTVSDTHPTKQSRYRLLREHVADHAIGLTLIQTASGSAGDNAACVLTPVLQQ